MPNPLSIMAANCPLKIAGLVSICFTLNFFSILIIDEFCIALFSFKIPTWASSSRFLPHIRKSTDHPNLMIPFFVSFY